MDRDGIGCLKILPITCKSEHLIKEDAQRCYCQGDRREHSIHMGACPGDRGKRNCRPKSIQADGHCRDETCGKDGRVAPIPGRNPLNQTCGH